MSVLRTRPGGRLQAGRRGHGRSGGDGGPVARRGHGLRRQRPGKAREADLGVASGNGKGQIFVKGGGGSSRPVPKSKIVETLIEEAIDIAEQMEKDGVASGEPAVTVSWCRHNPGARA